MTIEPDASKQISVSGESVSLENGPHIHNAKDDHIIIDVWENNFEEELKKLMFLVEKYKIIGMDTEFPGIVYRLE
eukprot:CAMPEP_0114585750 /NCGR_PEP_ID=MMETSP0125-20121206/9197_1 /TAXON_ID=485358 ORGANISM="Aristerostoma sp., Strain ATCC 50986" /NCGR_SAMPLE_ID=MMETSP0125 /ASSEMBLY_ACC=CAM_ASM_000245 /LENGTH=74 /DNA_ID=CAMNT_0001780947 /DNA_START=149 /DNA_END=373 /DNA_ORIENTATION=-